MDQIKLNVICGTETFSYVGFEKSIRIGRSLKCEFNIPKDDLSREHCLLEIDENTCFITDLASKNGLTINGKRLRPNVKTLITEDSNVVLANIYHLKINQLEIKTKADIVKKMINPEIDTRSFQLDIAELVEKPNLKKPRKKKINVQENAGPSRLTSQGSLKMIIGFIAILGFALYQAFGE